MGKTMQRVDRFLFGYIRPFQPELRMKEYEAYRSVYCGLCKELGRQFGVFSRLTLSYDFTFLAILSMGLQQSSPDFFKIRCPVNPLKKCLACRLEGITNRVAALAAITLYYKCEDQLSDEKLLTRLPVYMALPFFGHSRKKARETVPEYDRLMEEMTKHQKQVELQSAGPDLAAEPTAHALSVICENLSDHPVQKRVLSRFGYLLGRYIYLIDALDDLEKDEKKQRFNPFLQQYTAAKMKNLSYAPATESIQGTIAELEKAFALLELNDWQPILENIIFFGLKQSLQKILQKKEKNT